MPYTSKALRKIGFSNKKINTYQASPGKEKTAYKKGFEACLELLTQDWGQLSREEMINKGNMLMELLSSNNSNNQKEKS